jgi:hypothetical protein
MHIVMTSLLVGARRLRRLVLRFRALHADARRIDAAEHRRAARRMS